MLVVGGGDPRLYTGELATTPMQEPFAYYTVGVDSMSVGGQPVAAGAGSKGYVDTGTSGTFLALCRLLPMLLGSGWHTHLSRTLYCFPFTLLPSWPCLTPPFLTRILVPIPASSTATQHNTIGIVLPKSIYDEVKAILQSEQYCSIPCMCPATEANAEAFKVGSHTHGAVLCTCVYTFVAVWFAEASRTRRYEHKPNPPQLLPIHPFSYIHTRHHNQTEGLQQPHAVRGRERRILPAADRRAAGHFARPGVQGT